MLVVTGASGRYGRLVIEFLLARGRSADTIVAAVRNPGDVADLKKRGVRIREVDFDRPDTLVPAFAGASTLLLIPTSTLGRRHSQMADAIAAAGKSKVGRIAYAGFVNGDRSTLVLGQEHKQTEALIRRSDSRYILLRNGPYIEPFAGELGNVPTALATGELIGSAGEGKLSGASRDDLAEAAAIALSFDHPGDIVYELGGTAFTMAEVAQAISTLAKTPLVYKSIPVDQYCDYLVKAGFPEPIAEIAADATFASQRGDWHTQSTDLVRLLGRQSTPLVDVVERTMAKAANRSQYSHNVIR